MFFSDELNLNNEKEVKEIVEFLDGFNIKYEIPDKTFIIRDKGEIIGTGSVGGNILKYFFLKEEYKGEGLLNILYNDLLNHLLENGFDSFFVFTTPNNKIIFKSMGLNEVSSTDRVALFEGGFYNYNRWIEKTKSLIPNKEGCRAAIVVNCNPMTLGHKYLIEKALEKVQQLLIFVVEEDKSIFPFKDRFNIIKEELKNDNRITVIKGGPYIISQATFPTYFIKKKDEMLDIYTEIDGKIFGDKIAKDLEIDIRFFGSEPKDLVTLAYNNTLKRILGDNDIKVEIIERKKLEKNIVSASYVRELLSNDNKKEAYKYLPKATIEYLESDNGKEIIEKLKSKNK